MGTGLPWACRAPAPSLLGCCGSPWAFSVALHEPLTSSCLFLRGDGSLGCERPLCLGTSGSFCSHPAQLPASGRDAQEQGKSPLPLPRGCSGCLHRTLRVPAMGGSVAAECAMGGRAVGGRVMVGCVLGERTAGGCAMGGCAMRGVRQQCCASPAASRSPRERWHRRRGCHGCLCCYHHVIRFTQRSVRCQPGSPQQPPTTLRDPWVVSMSGCTGVQVWCFWGCHGPWVQPLSSRDG